MTQATIIILLLAIILALLIYLSFIKKFDTKAPEHIDHGKRNIPDSVEGLIPLDRAVNLIDNYETRRKLHNQLLPGSASREFGDAHSVYEDIDQVKAYLSYIERTSKEKGISVQGLRYYFGAYPVSDNTEKAGYQTLVIFPTVHDDKTGINHRAIDLERSTSGQDLFFIHKELNKSNSEKEGPNQAQQKNMMVVKSLSGASSAKNDMGSSPPRRPKNS